MKYNRLNFNFFISLLLFLLISDAYGFAPCPKAPAYEELVKSSKFHFIGKVIKKETLPGDKGTVGVIINNIRLHVKLTKSSSKKYREGDVIKIVFAVGFLNDHKYSNFDFSKAIEVVTNEKIINNEVRDHFVNPCSMKIRVYKMN